jgi:uncharacterized protein (TIGR03437 family)
LAFFPNLPKRLPKSLNWTKSRLHLLSIALCQLHNRVIFNDNRHTDDGLHFPGSLFRTVSGQMTTIASIRERIAQKIAHRVTILAILAVPSLMFGQQERITGRVGGAGRVVLSGNRNPKALPRFDAGRVDPELKLYLVTVVFKPSPVQQAALTALLAEQQDRSSSNYHRWITPEEYADRFGLNQADIVKVTSWLKSNNLTADYSARGRNWITCTGSARDIESAFGTEIHWYRIDGETHYANSTDPTIPAELADLVLGVQGLDDFKMKSPSSARRGTSNDAYHSGNPEYTFSNGTHALEPDDVATIYDIAPLFASGINGSGQRIVVVGQSDILLSDIATFRGGILPANVPQVLLAPGSPDPGITKDEVEADLDLEWVGAVARNATIIYVESTSAYSAAAYAISENLAPVINFSFGNCEQNISLSTAQSVENAALEASVQGITWLASSGDTGAADCDSQMALLATNGMSVNFPASLPQITGVGGTEFNEGAGLYWSAGNSPTLSSALSYIPEIAWNDSALGSLSASGGGASTLYAKPSWQAGPGVLNDGVRDVPDVAMAASPNHDPYVVVTNGTDIAKYGGTSAATPVFAGLVALLNQYYHSNGQGNINSNLYRIAQTNMFHDIVSGNNIVPCLLLTPNCTTGSFGYSAGIGYDLVTGLGSVDAYNLIANWNAPTPSSNVVLSCSPNPVYQQPPNSQGYSWLFTLSLTETAGVGTSITGLTIGGTDYSSLITSYLGTTTIPARGMLSATLGYKTLTVPTNIVFGFTGVDAGGRRWSQQVSISFNGPSSLSPLTIQTVPSGLQFRIDGGTLLTAPQTVNLSTSTTHNISIASPQAGSAGVRYAFSKWSDGGAPSHSFTLNAAATLTATFQTQYQLTISASPASGGTVMPTNGSFYNSGATVPISATPNAGYSFSSWTGAVFNASAAATTVTMSSPLNVTANFKPSVSPTAPTIIPGGVVPVDSTRPVVQPGSWISIYGTNLGPSTPVNWNGDFPTMLGGTSVTIDNKPAYIYFVSATQVNVQVPDDANVNQSVPVVVTVGGQSATSSVTLASVAPSFSLLGDNKHVAGIIIRADGSGAYGNGVYDIIGPSNNSLGYKTIPAKAGDSIQVYGVGFGPTTPTVLAGQAFSGAASTNNTVTLMFGSTTLVPTFAGISEAGTYQFNLTVPPNLGVGDVSIAAIVAGVTTAAGEPNAVISLQ